MSSLCHPYVIPMSSLCHPCVIPAPSRVIPVSSLCHPGPFSCHPGPFSCHPGLFSCHPGPFSCHPGEGRDPDTLDPINNHTGLRSQYEDNGGKNSLNTTKYSNKFSNLPHLGESLEAIFSSMNHSKLWTMRKAQNINPQIYNRLPVTGNSRGPGRRTNVR